MAQAVQVPAKASGAKPLAQMQALLETSDCEKLMLQPRTPNATPHVSCLMPHASCRIKTSSRPEQNGKYRPNKQLQDQQLHRTPQWFALQGKKFWWRFLAVLLCNSSPWCTSRSSGLVRVLINRLAGSKQVNMLVQVPGKLGSVPLARSCLRRC